MAAELSSSEMHSLNRPSSPWLRPIRTK